PASIALSDPHALLAREPFIRYDRNHWGGRLIDAYLRHAKIVPHERFELDALDAIAVMVARGLGVSLLPDWAPPWPENLALNRRRMDAPAFARRVGLMWMRDSASLRLVRVLQGLARATTKSIFTK